jgi:hypothetical protein
MSDIISGRGGSYHHHANGGDSNINSPLNEGISNDVDNKGTPMTRSSTFLTTTTARSLCLFPFDFLKKSQFHQLKEDLPSDNHFIKIGADAGALAVDHPAQAADGSAL